MKKEKSASVRVQILCLCGYPAYFSGMEEKKKHRFSESFVVGVIALVFMIVGYQTALFVYRAAVMKIVSNRDHPDTVYIRESAVVPQQASPSGHVRTKEDKNVTVRKQSEHSKVAEAVRQAVPRPKVESFRFDPNTASMEDFCRLGFSQKQAQAIENYRNKGGRFRRREDFAKSFVVSDSIYRRLESYIDIPVLDLNLADSADFDALPGIGGWFAQKMIAYRKALGGYSFKEQLMDIYRFTEDKYRALEDLVTVSPEHVVPYPLWTLPVDSLRLHPYIKDYETARSIVLFRENTPQSSWTVDALVKAGIVYGESAAKLQKCVVAGY